MSEVYYGRSPDDIYDAVGDVANGNYTEIEPDGTVVQHGSATVWDDLVNSLIGKKLFSGVGTIDYDYDENALKMQPNGGIDDTKDRVVFNLQYPHGAIANGCMCLHVHWEQTSSNKIEFTVQYRIQNNGEATSTTWTTVTSNSTDNSIFTYVSGNLNQITELAQVDMTGSNISSTVQFRFTRTDSTTGDILATFVDAHVEYDTGGSREEYLK